MYLRVVSALSGGQPRRYVQLMRSTRGAKGVSKTVVANLGSLPDTEIENLRRALHASRSGQAVVLPSAAPPEEWQLRVVANIAYLDVVVALAMWRYWKLTELFNRLLPRGAEQVATADILLPLVMQRCLAPGSKLYAQRWLPRTSLPELLGLRLDHFNNSRIHRALKDLDGVDPQLQDELAKRYEQRDGCFASLFLDVTDTYFQGRGCHLAERDRTKEGLKNVHKIGIVLLCNEHGYPLRWQVVAGKRRDPQIMEDMIDTVEALPWTRNVPFVCDRAMGHASGVARLVSSGLRFLTATRVTEIASYTEEVPSAAFENIWPADTELSAELDVERARKAAEAIDLEKVDDTLFVKDLGVCTRTLHVAAAPIDASGASHDPAAMEGGAAFVAFARILQRKLDAGEAKSKAVLAREQGLTRARITQLFNLLRLDLGLQERILRGDFGYVSERVLRKAVHCKGAEAQKKMLENYAEKQNQTGEGRGFRRTGPREVELRLIAYFNPEMFVEQRARAMRRRTEIDSWIAELNQHLRSLRRPREEVYRRVMNKLTGNNVVGMYDVQVDPIEGEENRWQVRLQPDGAEWRRRRRFDGFVLLIAHPELPQNARAMSELYRAKDAVERDFRTIKEVIKLRPVFHHTDPKVRAHVTLCMLGLLLDRTLEQRLRRSSTPLMASACFELLRECRLNLLRVAPEAPIQYRLTEPTAEQRAVLGNLRLGDLLDEEAVQAQIHPRDAA